MQLNIFFIYVLRPEENKVNSLYEFPGTITAAWSEKAKFLNLKVEGDIPCRVVSGVVPL